MIMYMIKQEDRFQLLKLLFILIPLCPGLLNQENHKLYEKMYVTLKAKDSCLILAIK